MRVGWKRPKLALAALAVLALVCSAGDRVASAQDYVGSYDDLPVADDDIQGLQQLLNDKWTYFLIEMDKYRLARDDARTDAMAEKMQLVFAERFRFHALHGDGSHFGDVQGLFSPREWLEAQNVGQWRKFKKTNSLFMPNHRHIMTILEPGQSVLLEGYSQHAYVGLDLRLAVGAARQLAFEEIIFEKADGAWRVTAYQATNRDMSELPSPKSLIDQLPEFQDLPEELLRLFPDGRLPR